MTAGVNSRKMFLPVLAAAFLALTVFASGCGDDGTSSVDPGALVQEGWGLFEAGDYQGALAKFDLAKDNSKPSADVHRDAWDGLGWSYARLGQLEQAKAAFLYVLSTIFKPSRDTYAGMAVVALALKDYPVARANAHWALTLPEYPPEYVFRYDPAVTDETLLLVRAIASFHEGEYEDAGDDVEDLGGPELNPNAPGFVARLLRAIQDLREEMGAGLL